MRESGDSGVRIVKRGIGFAAHGPGFYVWDVEPRSVIESALALVDPSRGPRPEPWAGNARRRLRARAR